MRLLVLVLSLAAASSYHLTGLNASNYVGRTFTSATRPVDGAWIAFSSGSPPLNENKVTFALPGSVVDNFFLQYESALGTTADCRKAQEAIGFTMSDIDYIASQYNLDRTWVNYVLIPTSTPTYTVGNVTAPWFAVTATWENVFTKIAQVYADWNAPTPAFTAGSLLQMLQSHLTTFEAWSNGSRYNTSFFAGLPADNGTTWAQLSDYRSAQAVTTASIMGSPAPSALRVRAWLNIKAGLNNLFLGTGETLNAGGPSLAGLPEMIMPVKTVDLGGGDILFSLDCVGQGYSRNPSTIAGVLAVNEGNDFRVYTNVDGFVRKATPRVVNINVTSRVISIHAQVTAATTAPGLLATFGVGPQTLMAATDATWRCTTGFNESWLAPGYDFSAWPVATARAQTVGDSNNANQNAAAQWIWTADPSNLEVFCMKDVGVYTAATRAPTPPTVAITGAPSSPPTVAPTPASTPSTDSAGRAVASFGLVLLSLAALLF